jgi:hypothetical protein
MAEKISLNPAKNPPPFKLKDPNPIPPSRGTKLTIDIAEGLGKPFFIVDLLRSKLDKDGFRAWLTEFNVKELNIAGHRESNGPGKVYSLAFKALRELLVYYG